MKNMTMGKIAAACKGELYLPGKEQPCSQEEGDFYRNGEEIKSVTIDSRKVEQGSLFIATRGERVDGHSFIPSAISSGAMGILCEEKPEKCEVPYILVEDSFAALRALAEYYRSQLSIKVVGITGSVGKTSTKEFIASVLSEKYCVHKTQGNFNNEIGLPLTVLSIRQEHEIAVLEMGISNFGEMHRLSRIARPDVCVMTNIGQCHLEFLGSREGILKAKSEIFDFMNPDGYVVVNGDDDLLDQMEQKSSHPVIRYGLKCENDYYASQVMSRGLLGSQALFHGDLKVFPVEVPLPGEHMVGNALAAAAVGILFGLTIEEIQKGIKEVKAVSGRSNIIRLKDYVVIDDCYNANPVSMRAAIDLLGTAIGRKVAILGDMLELGTDEKRLHREIGTYVMEKEIDVLICVGALGKEIFDQADQEHVNGKGPHKAELYYFATLQEAEKKLLDILKRGDSILLKASHGMHFEKLVEMLQDI